MFKGKGMSINVNLSDEQMEHIACLTADKVNQTRTHYMTETEILQREVQDLRREIERRDKLTVEELLRTNRYKEMFRKLKEHNEKLQLELDELKNIDDK